MENTQTTKVTCKNIAIGDTIICQNYIWIENGQTESRDEIPMTIASIETEGTGTSTVHSYYAADGTFINYGSGARRIRKVVAS